MSDGNARYSEAERVTNRVLVLLYQMDEMLDGAVQEGDAERIRDIMEQYQNIAHYSSIHLNVTVREKHPEKYLECMRKSVLWMYPIRRGRVLLKGKKTDSLLELILNNLGKDPMSYPRGKDDVLGVVVKKAWFELLLVRKWDVAVLGLARAKSRPDLELYSDEALLGLIRANPEPFLEPWTDEVLTLPDYRGNEWLWGSAIFDFLFRLFGDEDPVTDSRQDVDGNFNQDMHKDFANENPGGMIENLNWNSKYYDQSPFIYSLFYRASESSRNKNRRKKLTKFRMQREAEISELKEIETARIQEDEGLRAEDVKGSFYQGIIAKRTEPATRAINKKYDEAEKAAIANSSITDGVFRRDAIKQIVKRIKTYS